MAGYATKQERVGECVRHLCDDIWILRHDDGVWVCGCVGGSGRAWMDEVSHRIRCVQSHL